MKRIISAVVIVASAFYSVIDRVAAASTERPSNDQRGVTKTNQDYKAVFERSGDNTGKSIYYETPSPAYTSSDRMHG
jgi:Na+/H+ antiporter NhaB